MSTTTTIKESDGCPEMDVNLSSHGRKDLSFLYKKRMCLEPNALMAEFQLKDQTIPVKVIEIMTTLTDIFREYGFQYRERSQKWLDKRQNITNEKDLQRVRMSCHIYDKTVRSLIKYMREFGDDSWIALLKWKLASFFAFHEHQDIPPKPWVGDQAFLQDSFFQPHLLMGGTYHNFYEQLSEYRKETFRNTVLNGLKKSSPDVSDKYVTEAEMKTFKFLTDPNQKRFPQDYQDLIIDVPALTEKGTESRRDKVFLSGRFNYTRVDHSVSQVNREQVRIRVENFQLEARRLIREVFQGKTKGLRKEFDKPFFLSTSANYMNNTALMGSVGSFYSDFRGTEVWAGKKGSERRPYTYEDVVNQTDRIMDIQGHPFFSVPRPPVFKTEEVLDEGITFLNFREEFSKHYGQLGEDEDLTLRKLFDASLEVPTMAKAKIVDSTDFLSRYQIMIFKWYNEAVKCENIAIPMGLRERLKARIISKADPRVQTLCSFFQKWSHKILRKIPCFELIGKPVDDEIINNILDDLKGSEFEVVSGDYKAATDNLHSWISNLLIREMFDLIDEEWDVNNPNFPSNFVLNYEKIIKKNMTGHMLQITEEYLDYNDCYKVDREFPDGRCQMKGEPKKKYRFLKGKQTRGQLMGSTVSFIFLCLANALVCRMAMETSERRIYAITERESERMGIPLIKLRINGDDCLFYGRIGRIRTIWEKIAGYIGLESSIGKTYFSQTMCTVNSRVYRWRNDKWIYSPYINYGLLKGIKKTSSKEDRENGIPVYKMGTYLRDLKNSCPSEMWPVLKKQFIYYNMNKLKEIKNLPWYLPEWLGGLGFPNDGELTEHDRKLGQYIKLNYKALRPVKCSEDPEWLLHQEFNKTIKDIDTVYCKQVEYQGHYLDVEQEHSASYKNYVISMLFSKELSQIFKKILKPEAAGIKALNHNQRIYCRARKQVLPEPISDRDLELEQIRGFECVITRMTPLTSMVRM
jgi:hypothetical protein